MKVITGKEKQKLKALLWRHLNSDNENKKYCIKQVPITSKYSRDKNYIIHSEAIIKDKQKNKLYRIRFYFGEPTWGGRSELGADVYLIETNNDVKLGVCGV